MSLSRNDDAAHHRSSGSAIMTIGLMRSRCGGVEVMDRDEALRLLRGGPEGVAEWNRCRDAGEEVPALRAAALRAAHLGRADLVRADLRNADLGGADLVRADLRNADLGGADLVRADLGGTDLAKAGCGETVFADVDLSEVKGLDRVRHDGPSTLGTNTLIRTSRVVRFQGSTSVLGSGKRVTPF